MSDHLLLQCVGRQLLEHLEPLTYVDQVDYFPAGHWPTAKQRAPDICVTLDAAEIVESGLLTIRQHKAEILITAGRRMAKCRSSYCDHLTPPLVDFRWSGRLDHQSTTVGIASSAAKYRLVADNIAQQIAAKLQDTCDDFLQQDGPLPQLPDTFWPPYYEPPQLTWLTELDAQQLTSFHGLMNHNQTTWRFADDGELSHLVEQIESEMLELGWKTSSRQLDESRIIHLRMSQGPRVLELFPVSSDVGQRNTPGGDSSSAADAYFVQYLDRMSREEIRSALDDALATNVPAESMLLFESFWSTRQSEQVLERFITQMPQSPHAQLAVARIYHQAKQKDAARDAMRRATLLLRTVHDVGNLDGKLTSLAKKLGMQQELKKLKQEPDIKLLEQLGFIQLLPGQPYDSLELMRDEPALFYGHTADGELKTVAIRPADTSSIAAASPFEISHVVVQSHGRSYGRGGSTCGLQLDGVCRASFACQPVDTTDQYRVAIELTALEPSSKTP